MIVVRDLDLLKDKKLVATIGFFDGVHLGHRFLINEMRDMASERDMPSAVITFTNHPRAVLNSEFKPRLLNSLEEKSALLSSTGIDYCVLLDFTLELSRLSAEEFISQVLSDRLHVKGLIIGYDHRFGHDRRDGFEQYVEYGKRYGIEVIKASQYDDGNTTVSSSEIRKSILSGDVAKAAGLLTYPYQLTGHIVSGYRVGRTLGFPTANIEVDNPLKILPAIGVYAVWVYVRGKRHKGMLYIGNRPTLNNGDNISLEVNILDFEGDIYNDEIKVDFIEFVRGDIRFNSLDELKAQLQMDRERVCSLL